MSLFESLGICFLLALALFIIPFLLFGHGAALLIVIFPAIIAENITGSRGLDFSNKSFFYLLLLFFFILCEVLIVTLIFFGIYCIFWGFPAYTEIQLPHTIEYTQINRLLLLNKILLILLTYFLGMFIYQAIKYRAIFKTMDKKFIYLYRILPLKIFPLAFIYLIASLIFLFHYNPTNSLGTVASIAGCTYAIYICYTAGRSLFHFSRTIQHGFQGFNFKQGVQLFTSLAYNVAFLYFFYHTIPFIKLF